MRVLLIEDEERLARAIAEGLSHEGFNVELVGDGVDGFAQARTGTFDAIVLDILLPGMNGYEVCRKLREAEVWTPILMLTAKDGEYDEAEGLDTGADDFLRKPFSFVVLAARLRALARRGQSPRPAVLAAGDLTFDPATRECHVNADEVSLTRRESGLLETLMRSEGDVVSKSDLLESVWGSTWDANPNVVEVYIGYLRRKVGPERIKTIRGSGYRMVDPDA